jgi:hypothetical protein
MNTTAEEKIWLVMEAVTNAYEITPSGSQIIIDPKTVLNKVTEIELDRILNKLEKDHALINIVKHPSDFEINFVGTAKCFSIIIPDYSAFRRHLNFTHSRHFGGIDRIEGNNFLSICDVAMDILAELQVVNADKEGVSIKIVPDVIRFSALLPAKSVGLLDRYGDYRMKALGYMKDRDYIIDYEIQKDMYLNRWDQEIYVKVDRFNFEKFYQQLGIVYQRRVVDPAKKAEKNKPKKEKTTPSISNIPSMKVEIVGMPVVQTKSIDENIITKNKKVISLPKFPPTEWSKVIWRFIDERNVLIGTEKELKPSDFQALGFENETKEKPDLTWLWFFDIATREGNTQILPKPIPDAVKQKKLRISNLLKKLFKNDTDPFYDTADTQTYRLKIKIFPPQVEEEKPIYDPKEMFGDLG